MKKAKPNRLKAQRFARLVESTALVLETGRPTVFAFEGACRRGLRVSLILDGWTWADALLVVHAALQKIRAVRPTWLQGQVDFTTPSATERYRCERCGGVMAEDRRSSARYCSSLCRVASAEERARRHGERVSRSEYLASLALKREADLRQSIVDCGACGRSFSTRRGALYCSTICQAQARRKILRRPCQSCGTSFLPRDDGARYCSAVCGNAGRVKVKPERQCLSCSTVFRLRWATQAKVYCSRECSKLGPARAPRKSATIITPLIFDRMFHQRRGQITDTLFADAA